MNHYFPRNAWKPGESGNPGGRPPGAKNKARFDIAKILRDNDFDPIYELIEIARDKKYGVRVRREACSDLLSYVCPKLKSVDLAELDETSQAMQSAVLLIHDNNRGGSESQDA